MAGEDSGKNAQQREAWREPIEVRKELSDLVISVQLSICPSVAYVFQGKLNPQLQGLELHLDGLSQYFLVQALLAFGAGQFFIVQYCPVYCKTLSS